MITNNEISLFNTKMCTVKLLLWCVLFLGICLISLEGAQLNNATMDKGQMKISAYVRAILNHYKQKDPIGLPGAPIPDPQDVPPISHSFSVGKITMNKMKLFGLSKFRIDYVHANLAAMEAEVALKFDRLEVFGNYTLSSFFTRSAGPFTIKLKNVFGKAVARLEVERSGKLEAQDINMDVGFENMDMNFERLGILASIFQSIINSVGNVVFESIKPYLLKEANTNIRREVNKQVKKIPQQFPNSISPLDQLIAEARTNVRNSGYDPYKVNDYNHTAGLVTIQMTHTWIMGCSSFHRVGNITFEMKNNSIFGKIEVGTQKLQGTSHWEVAFVGGILSRTGTVGFSVEYIKAEVSVIQSMDTREPPVLDDIQLELGNIQVRFDGAGTLDYLIEFGINILPNVLRYQIMDALEAPLKKRIQEKLNQIDVEKLILENTEKFDEGKFGNLEEMFTNNL